MEPVPEDAWVIKKQVNEVSVLFTASAKGKYVADLTRNDVIVRDDDQTPAAVLDFHSQNDLPLRVGLLVDTSGSVTENMRFERAAAAAFLREVIRGHGDLGFVMGFANAPLVTQDLTADPALLTSGLAALKPGGGTALFDAVVAACHKLVNRDEDQVVARVLVVISDGDDNSSQMHPDEAIEFAQQDGVTIFTISSAPTSLFDTTMNELHAPGNKNLKKLAEQTGGQALLPSSAREVAHAFSKIQEDLRGRYYISYRPANFVTNGRYHHIKILAHKQGQNLHVRARAGYYARMVPPSWAANTQ
jgi:VWFA-related protein